MMERISKEVIELTNGSEDSKDSRKSRKSLEKRSVIRNDRDEKKTQDANSEFQEYSQNLQTEAAVETFEIEFEEKSAEK